MSQVNHDHERFRHVPKAADRAQGSCYRGVGALRKWPQTIAHLKGPRPPEYDYLIPVSLISASLCVCITLPLALKLSARFFKLTKDLSESNFTTGIVCWPAFWMGVTAAAPCVIAVLKMLAVMAPTIWKMLFLLASIYEAAAFWCFKKLVFSFIGKDDEEILGTFAETHATKMWTAPPLGCCFRRCVRERRPNARDLQSVRTLLAQFMIACPVLAALEMSEKLSYRAHKVIGRIEMFSLMLAMYALFALLIATHALLPDHKLHAKFWSIKGTFVASTAVFRIFCEFISKDVQMGDRCYTSETIAAAQAGTVTGIIAVGLSGLAWYAFKPEDLDSKKK